MLTHGTKWIRAQNQYTCNLFRNIGIVVLNKTNHYTILITTQENKQKYQHKNQVGNNIISNKIRKTIKNTQKQQNLKFTGSNKVFISYIRMYQVPGWFTILNNMDRKTAVTATDNIPLICRSEAFFVALQPFEARLQVVMLLQKDPGPQSWA